MRCPICKQYVYDSLIQPTHPHDYYYKRYKHSRFMKIAEEISERVLEVLVTCSPSEYNECKYMDPFYSYDTAPGHPVFGAKISHRDYRDQFMSSIRIFLYFKRRNPYSYDLLKQVLYTLMEHCVLAKTVFIDDYQEWFAQKFIFLLLHFPSVHHEHAPKPPPLRIRITLAVEEYDDLYQ